MTDLPPPAPGSTPLPPPDWRTIPPDTSPMPEPSGPPAPPAPSGPSAQSAQSEPPAPSGPPPREPSAPTGGEHEPRPSRITAARWVAAAGALLLLAAAGTFLAVSWDRMGLTSRVLVVGTVTAAAIVGGYRMRRRLPAVGAVVFHLGALLLPVDAFGLAIQLDAPAAGRWLAVGGTAVLLLPVLAVLGRSRSLGWGAIAGVPVLATGLGLVEVAPAPLAVAAAAMVIVGLGASVAPGRRVRQLVATAGVVLGTVAVGVPVLVAALSALPPSSAASAQIRAAGWEPVSSLIVLATTLLAVAAVVLAATRARSTRLALVAIVTGCLGALSALIPAAPDDAVLVVLPTAVILLVELAAVLTRHDRLWSGPSRQVAVAAEVVAGLLLPSVAAAAIVVVHGRTGTDNAGTWAIAMVVLAGAWALAVGRRWPGNGFARRSPLIAVLAGTVIVHLAAASFTADLPVALGVAILLAGASSSLLWLPGAPLGGEQDARRFHAWSAAALVAMLLIAAAWVQAIGDLSVLSVLAVAALVPGAHLRMTVAASGDGTVNVTRGLVLLAGIGLVVAGAVSFSLVDTPMAASAAPAAIVGLLTMASLSGPDRATATFIHVVAAALGLLTTSSLFLDPAVRAPATDVLRLPLGGLEVIGPSALVPSAIAAIWLIIEVARRQDRALAAVAAPVVVRALASLAAVAGMEATIAGRSLIGVAIACALALAFGAGWWAPPLAVTGLSAALAGLAMAELTPELRAVLLLSVGLVIAAAGITRRRALVGHLGGATAVLGAWQLLGVRGVEAADLWLLPVAAQIWVAGLIARRTRGTSSWLTDVPPLLLVALPALAERLAGGPGWHAVLAGGLAVAAIVGGGGARLGGPLVVGTGLLVAVVGIEVFAVVAAVPTWIWLAAGGAMLLGAAAAMELVDGSPITAARRAVRVLREGFD